MFFIFNTRSIKTSIVIEFFITDITIINHKVINFHFSTFPILLLVCLLSSSTSMLISTTKLINPLFSLFECFISDLRRKIKTFKVEQTVKVEQKTTAYSLPILFLNMLLFMLKRLKSLK